MRQVAGLALPAWVDSVHHTLLVRILLEQMHIPETWGPYLPQVPFYYHFGFHISVAVFALILGASDLQLGQIVLVVGQIWQVILVLAVYLLANALWQSRNKAVVAMLLVGFVSQMPAYYAAWGRYTLLAGLTLLILAMTAALLKRPILLGILTASIAITHYYALFLLLIFIGFLALFKEEKWKTILAGCTTGLLVVTPWLWRVVSHGWYFAYPKIGINEINYLPTDLWALLGPFRNYIMLGLALVGTIVTINRLRKIYPTDIKTAVFLCWTFMIIVLLGPWHVGPFRPDHAAIVLFLPAVLFAVEGMWSAQHPALIGSILILLIILGIVETQELIKPKTILATSSDLAALEWIEENTSSDATFLIDVAPWFGIWRGVDGGWWIMPLIGRKTTLPPLTYAWGSFETITSVAEDAQRIYELRKIKKPQYCVDLVHIMQRAKANFYYTHSGRPEWCPHVTQVYRGQNGIAIYRLQ